MIKNIFVEFIQYFRRIFLFFLFSSFLFYCSTEKENYTEFLKLEGSKFIWEIRFSQFSSDESISRLEYSPEDFKKIIINYSSRNKQVHKYTLSLLHSDMLIFPLMSTTTNSSIQQEIDMEYDNLIKDFRNLYPNLSSLEIERKNENQKISLKSFSQIILDPTPASTIYQKEGKDVLDKYLINEKWVIPSNSNWSNRISYITFCIGLLIIYSGIRDVIKSNRKGFFKKIVFFSEYFYTIFGALIFFAIANSFYQAPRSQTVELNNKSFHLSYSKFFGMYTENISFDIKNIQSIYFNPKMNVIEFEAILNETKPEQKPNQKFQNIVWELDRTDLNHKERILVAHYICGEIYNRTLIK